MLAEKLLGESKTSLHWRCFFSKPGHKITAAAAQHTVTMSFFRNPSSSSSCLSKSNKALARLRRFLWIKHKIRCRLCCTLTMETRVLRVLIESLNNVTVKVLLSVFSGIGLSSEFLNLPPKAPRNEKTSSFCRRPPTLHTKGSANQIAVFALCILVQVH